MRSFPITLGSSPDLPQPHGSQALVFRREAHSTAQHSTMPVLVKTSDEEEFELSSEVANLSVTIRNMIEGVDWRRRMTRFSPRAEVLRWNAV